MGSLDVTTSNENADHGKFYAKSLVRPNTAKYDDTSALALVERLNSYAGLQGMGNSASFGFLGPLSFPSAKADKSGSSSNAHDASLVYQFYSYGFPGNDDADAQQEVWNALDDMVATGKASGDVEWTAFANYIDAKQADWGKAYYDDALSRLKSLKAKWDGADVIWFPQALSSA